MAAEAPQEEPATPIKGLESVPETAQETESEPEPEPSVRLYEIPLSDELQSYTFDLCEEHGVDYEMVLALMSKESSYRPNIISKTSDYGLMQINTINHERLEKELGITDFLDAKQNILCGVYMLGELTAKYEDLHRVLMAYNFGESGARKYVADGNSSSPYSRAIMEIRADILESTP